MAIVACATISNVEAQKIEASLTHYSVDNGLVSDNCSDLIQDDYGYLWVATWNGLSRFDGTHFYNYPTGYRSKVPLMHNRIVEVVTDIMQNVWLRMYDGRVFVLDRSTDTFINPLTSEPGYENLKTNHKIKVTSSGDVYTIIDGVGIYKMRLAEDVVKTELITTGELVVNAIIEGYKGDLWAGTTDGVHRINLSDATVERTGIMEGEEITVMYTNGYNIYGGTRSGKIFSFAYGQDPQVIREFDEPISCIFVDSHQLIWYSLNGQGVSRLNTETGNIKSFWQPLLAPEFDVRGSVVSETNGRVWIIMNHGGFGYYNRETDEVEYFHNNPANAWDLSNIVACHLALPEGVVFESTQRRGLEKLEIIKNTITRNMLLENRADGTSNNDIRALFYDKERKTLLIGNKTSSLFLFHDGQRTEIKDDGHGHPLGRIYGIAKGKDGSYWISSKGQGVIHMEPTGATYKYTFYQHNDDDPNSLSMNSAYQTVEDRDGNIWVATYGGGVNIITKEGKVLNRDNGGIREYPRMDYNRVRTLTLDSEGNVWAGSTDGILIMSIKNGKVAVEKVLDNGTYDQNLMSNDIVCLATDQQGTVWIGTNGGGLNRTIERNKDGNWLFETFTSHEGLPSDEIKSIAFDDRGSVWFATDHILCSFDTKKQIFSIFSTLDGVDGTICSEGGALCIPGGNILFGTINGYYAVNLRKLIDISGSMIKLRITDFFLNDELMSPRLNNVFDYYVPEAKEVSIPSHGSVFSFRFTSLNYQLQHRIHYQYKLEGYDKEWQNADRNRIASYAGVPAGKYTFMVKAFLLESPDKYDVRSIDVIIPAPLFLSTTAIWIYVVAALIIVAAIILWRRKRKK